MTEPSLAGKIILITGGGRGLGRAMALGLARAGAAGITITAASSRDEIDYVAAEIDGIRGPGHALALMADVTNIEDCRTAIELTLNQFGGLHVLINNAGKGQRFTVKDRAPFWKAEPEGWRQIVDTNINGPFFMARTAVAPMMEVEWGRIINISKSRDAMHRQNETPYGLTKAALEAATLSWAQDLDGTGITVNSLAPGGGVDTDFLLPSVRRRSQEARRAFLSPDVMVPPVLWLASELSDGITGCRYMANLWDQSLAPHDAAEGAREPAIFLPPTRRQLLEKTWKPPAG